MDTPAPKIEIALSTNKNHLIFTQTVYDEHGLSTSNKVGSLRIDKARAEKALAAAKTKQWEYVGEPINGFYEMAEITSETAPASQVAENELAK